MSFSTIAIDNGQKWTKKTK